MTVVVGKTDNISAMVGRLWEVYQTDDGGMGYHQGTIGFFKLESDAKSVVEGDRRYDPFRALRSVDALEISYGGKVQGYYILARPDMVQLGNLKELQRALRASGLAKLSVAEKQALGLKDE